MPVDRFSLGSRLQVRYHIGENDEGEPVYRLRSLAQVKADSTDVQLMEVVEAITGLQIYPVSEVRRVDNFELAYGE